jgi:hypothetical protein
VSFCGTTDIQVVLSEFLVSVVSNDTVQTYTSLPFTGVILFITAEELQALKEEFNHHQDKIDQYYSLLKDVEERPNDTFESKLMSVRNIT